jgi:hypothetical protein
LKAEVGKGLVFSSLSTGLLLAFAIWEAFDVLGGSALIMFSYMRVPSAGRFIPDALQLALVDEVDAVDAGALPLAGCLARGPDDISPLGLAFMTTVWSKLVLRTWRLKPSGPWWLGIDNLDRLPYPLDAGAEYSSSYPLIPAYLDSPFSNTLPLVPSTSYAALSYSTLSSPD